MNRMCDGFMVAATTQVPKIERVSHISPDAQRPRHRRFVHRRYARLDKECRACGARGPAIRPSPQHIPIKPPHPRGAGAG